MTHRYLVEQYMHPTILGCPLKREILVFKPQDLLQQVTEALLYERLKNGGTLELSQGFTIKLNDEDDKIISKKIKNESPRISAQIERTRKTLHEEIDKEIDSLLRNL